MSKLIERPEVQVFAGPNGSGKSTITSNYPIVGEYINADDIQLREKIDTLEAAKRATALKQFYVKNHLSFTFETVLSSNYSLEILEEAKAQGYLITVVYVITIDPQINANRVRQRVLKGGHDVPEEKITARYYRSLENIKKVYLLSDNFVLIDNSFEKPRLLVDKSSNHVSLFPNINWSEERIGILLGVLSI